MHELNCFQYVRGSLASTSLTASYFWKLQHSLTFNRILQFVLVNLCLQHAFQQIHFLIKEWKA